MLIPEDTELPPDYVLVGNIYPSWIDITRSSFSRQERIPKSRHFSTFFLKILYYIKTILKRTSIIYRIYRIEILEKTY